MTPPDIDTAETASQENWTEAVLLFLMMTSMGANRYAILKLQEDDPDHLEVTTNSIDIRDYCATEDVPLVPLKDFHADGNSHISIMTSIKPDLMADLDIRDPESSAGRYTQMLRLFKYSHGKDSFRESSRRNGFAILPADILEYIRTGGRENSYKLRGNFVGNMMNSACYSLMAGKPVYQRFIMSAHPVYERHGGCFYYNYSTFMVKRCWSELFVIDTKTTIGWNTSPYFKKVMWSKPYTRNTPEFENVLARIAGTQERWQICDTGYGAPYVLKMMEVAGDGSWNITPSNRVLAAFPEEDLLERVDYYEDIPTAETFSCSYKGPEHVPVSGRDYVWQLMQSTPEVMRDAFIKLYKKTTSLPPDDIEIITDNYHELCKRIPWSCSTS